MEKAVTVKAVVPVFVIEMGLEALLTPTYALAETDSEAGEIL